MTDRDTGPSGQQINYLTRRSFLTGAAATLVLAACGRDFPEPVRPSSTANPNTEPSSTETETSAERYPEHTVAATTFWIGEKASDDNEQITNEELAWDIDPEDTFGGVDDPQKRGEQGLPAFVPKHNPYYVALPIHEFSENGLVEGARHNMPQIEGVDPTNEEVSAFKGLWVKITNPKNGKVIHAQVIDEVNADTPEEVQLDHEYVFEGAEPRPTLSTPIDLSPSATYALLGDEAEGADLSQTSFDQVTWQFVDGKDVPDGPWKQFPPIDNSTNWG